VPNQDTPMPGQTEFSAEEEKQMRQARAVSNAAQLSLPPLPIAGTARKRYNSDAAKNATRAEATD